MEQCIQNDRINEVENRVTILENNTERNEKWMDKIDAKTDKILWFMMGSFVTAIVALIGFIGTLIV